MRLRYDVVQCYVFRHAYGGGTEFLQLRRAPGEYLAGTWQTIYGRGSLAHDSGHCSYLRGTGLPRTSCPRCLRSV
jgi:hypothetical protein